MSLNDTPSGERLHIGIFGKRNAGKSSLMNAITNQQLSIVSEIKGTTTDPVMKTMELLPLGPIVMMDTPGLDDDSELGEARIEKTKQILGKTDLALLVVDGKIGMTIEEESLEAMLIERKIPYITVYNKMDLLDEEQKTIGVGKDNDAYVSATKKLGIEELKEAMGKLIKEAVVSEKPPIVMDLVDEGDLVILVIPIDSAAPKGRIILPQQQTLRELLDVHARALCVQDVDLEDTLRTIGVMPKLVITDSQAFAKVASVTPKEISLTSFSILMARHKGDLTQNLEGVKALENLKDGDSILICEGCTHHRQCDDIGTVKIPKWMEEYTGKTLSFTHTSGTEFPEDVSGYTMIVHCGGCMLNEKEMESRLCRAKAAGVPMCNYGILIAQMKGILSRSIEILKK